MRPHRQNRRIQRRFKPHVHSSLRFEEVESNVIKPDPVAAIGFAKRHGLPARTSADWLKVLREGEED